MDAVRKIDLVELARLKEAGEREHTPPDPVRLIFALRQIGYNLEQALADLLDNSIAAGANSVLIRFLCDSERIRSLAIVDDGAGMNERELSEAMRFGSAKERDRFSLSRFGMGLKLASFSHARSLTVLTRQRGRAQGRRWTINGINAGWGCDRLDQAEVASMLRRPWGGIDLKRNGTVVLWDDIDRFSQPTGGLRTALRTIQRRLEVHLGLAFHRFLENGTVKIAMDQQRIGTSEHGIRIPVKPLNPFAYPGSGSRQYPKTYTVSIQGVGDVEAEAHIWPPNSELSEYKLGHKAAARQGFYFYRNDRLIQAGGWNGVVQHDAEPHSSLARVRIDLPPDLDTRFGLNVQKSAVVVPPGFEDAVEKSRSTEGESFDAFRRTAQLVYRKQDRKGAKLLPAVPGNGMPVKVQRAAETMLDPKAAGTRMIDFRWDELPADTVFDIDRDDGVLRLNKAYRERLLRELPASTTDLPVVKMLLFLLLKDEFLQDRVSAVRRTRLANINHLLREAILMDKG